MILVVATIRVQPDKQGDYEALCRDMLPKVRASEPGVLFYDVGKSRDEPHTYRVIEAYRDEEAVAIHLWSKFIEASLPALTACIVEMDIRLHDTIG